MNKLLVSCGLCMSFILMSGCTTVETVSYDPGYNTDYAYSVSYYGNTGRPYWGSSYYMTNYGMQPNAYWGTYDYYSNYDYYYDY